MRRRIFIGIDLPQKDKERLSKAKEEWADLPVRWGRTENHHLTLVFLGYADDGELEMVIGKVKIAVKNIESFDVLFDKMVLGPPGKPPRMFWLVGEKSEPLIKLRNIVEKSLGMLVNEKRGFLPHITLGRIRRRQWESLESAPPIEKTFHLTLSVESVQIFESVVENGIREYIVLENCPLGTE